MSSCFTFGFRFIRQIAYLMKMGSKAGKTENSKACTK